MGRSGSLLGSALSGCRLIFGDPERDPNLENYPYGSFKKLLILLLNPTLSLIKKAHSLILIVEAPLLLRGSNMAVCGSLFETSGTDY